MKEWVSCCGKCEHWMKKNSCPREKAGKKPTVNETPCEKYKKKGAQMKCECGDEYLWYDEELGIWRCRNCGWCS